MKLRALCWEIRGAQPNWDYGPEEQGGIVTQDRRIALPERGS
jgi:hypothetical protein